MSSTIRTVSDVMTKNPVTVDPLTPLDQVIKLLDKHGFRHLPIVQAGVIHGILSDRDMLLATGWMGEKERLQCMDGQEIPGPRLVSEIEHTDVTTIEPGAPTREALRLVLEHRIGALPVVEDESLVGILTESDLLRDYLADCADDPDGAGATTTVGNHMTSHVRSVGLEDAVDEALELCHDKDVRHFPVLDGGELVGIVSDRDLRMGLCLELLLDARAEVAGKYTLSRLKISDVVTRDVLTLPPDASLARAADWMLARKIGAVPIVDGDELVGILTQTDVLRALAKGVTESV
jgi:CBS domain-containing protein